MRRASLPDSWLFTDERLGGAEPDDPLWQALVRLPRGGGVVFRHYSWPEGERRALLARVCAVARRRGLLVVGSGMAAPGGVHRPAHVWRGGRPVRGLVTAAAHSRYELLAAFRAGADLVFLSPLFPTESHPGGRALGVVRFGLVVRGAPGPVVALGGMTPSRARRLAPLGAAGFGAIGYWAGPSPGSQARAAGR